MDDSAINPILLSSSAHLENVEQLIKNLERKTLDLDNFEHILSDQKRQEIITKSFSSVSTNPLAIDDVPDDSFFVKSISMPSHGASAMNDGNLSMDSLFNHRDLFDQSDYKQQQTPPANDQSLYADQDVAFTWDDQYDTRANYRLTFSTDKQAQAPSSTELKKERSHRHKHHRHRHHKPRSNDAQVSSSMFSDDGLPTSVTNQMNDWSMRSSFNALEQSIDQGDSKSAMAGEGASVQLQGQQATNVIRSQSHPNSFSPAQQIPTNKDNASPNSSTTTSSSSSTSWRKMKDSQRTTSGMETKETRPPSPMSLYKIFQQKSQMAASSSSRSAFQIYRQQGDSVVPNATDSMTISGEKLQAEKSRSSGYQKRAYSTDRRSSQTTNPSTDQAIQTSMFTDSPALSRFQTPTGSAPKSESYDQLASQTNRNSVNYLTVPSRPSPAPISNSTVNKSLPDLSFISQYSKELPRSRTVSPVPPSTNATAPTPAPAAPVVPAKQDSERPRTLKSIKRYKNNKHSTEPLGVFFSPQLGKTFAAVPASAVIQGARDSPTIIKMRLPPAPSPVLTQTEQGQPGNLKSCLKYGSRANSCDIQAMLQGGKAPTPSLLIPEPAKNQMTSSPISKRRCSETDTAQKRPETLWAPGLHATGSSNELDAYQLKDLPHERYSDHDIALILQQHNQTKKSVSFSENIAKHLISPCNPAIKFDPAPEQIDDGDHENPTVAENELTLALHGNKNNTGRKPVQRYGEMRRCQTDVIVMDRVHHLHSFTESPPNEFRFQDTDGAQVDPESDNDDQAIMEKAHVNIIPDTTEEPTPAPVPTPAAATSTEPSKKEETNETNLSFNDKENEMPQPNVNGKTSNVATDATYDSSLNDLLERITGTVKRIFDIKRSEKTFFLANEQNTQLDHVLKNELCTNLQQMLEHGLKPQRKDLSQNKQLTLWKIIENSIDHGSSLQVFHDARQIAQNVSPYWFYQFQAFIFALLNKNELINWLYHYMKQKDLLQRYYQSPDALFLVALPSTFTLFDRMMVQLEKLTPLAFRLVYVPPPLPAQFNETLNTSTISAHSNKNSAREWVMNISRRTSKTLTQPIVSTTTAAAATPASPSTPSDTLRSTFTRKIGSLFSKTNTAPQPQRKTSSAVTAKLPTPKPSSTIRAPSPAGATATTTTANRSRTSNVFANANAAATAASKPVIVASPKLNNNSSSARSGSMRRGISPSVVVAPSPPPNINTPNSTFQSKIPRPSLNVDKPKSTRYRSSALPPK